MLRRSIEWSGGFARTGIGKATLGLFSGVLFACFPQVPGYACSAFAFYYCIHQSRPVALEIYEDLRNDLRAYDDQPGDS